MKTNKVVSKPLTAGEKRKIKQLMCKMGFKRSVDSGEECFIAADSDDKNIIIVVLFRDGFLNVFACDTRNEPEFDTSPTIIADDPLILDMLRKDTKTALLILCNSAVLILQGKLKVDLENNTVEFNDVDDDLFIL